MAKYRQIDSFKNIRLLTHFYVHCAQFCAQVEVFLAISTIETADELAP